MNNERELRLLTALTEIYNKTQDYNAISLTRVLRENKCSYITSLTSVIRNQKIVIFNDTNSSKLEYKWNTIKPNLMMINRLLDELKRNKNTEKSDNSIDKVKFTDDELNAFRYLNYIYELTKNNPIEIQKDLIARKFKVNNFNRAPKALSELKYVHMVGKNTFWQAKKPTMEMAVEFNKKTYEISSSFYQERKKLEDIVLTMDDFAGYKSKFVNSEVLVKESNMLKTKLEELKIVLKYADTNEFKLSVYEKFINEISQ